MTESTWAAVAQGKKLKVAKPKKLTEKQINKLKKEQQGRSEVIIGFDSEEEIERESKKLMMRRKRKEDKAAGLVDYKVEGIKPETKRRLIALTTRLEPNKRRRNGH